MLELKIGIVSHHQSHPHFELVVVETNVVPICGEVALATVIMLALMLCAWRLHLE